MTVRQGMTFSPSWRHYSIEILLTSGLWIAGSGLIVTRPLLSSAGFLCLATGAGILLRAAWSKSTTRYVVVDNRVECRRPRRVTASTLGDYFFSDRIRLRISPLQRLLGVGTVAIFKSGSRKDPPDIVIYGVSSPEVFRRSLIDRSSSILHAVEAAEKLAHQRIVEANEARQRSCRHDQASYLLNSGSRYCSMCDAGIAECDHQWRITHSYKEDTTEECHLCGMVNTNMGIPMRTYPSLHTKCPACRKPLRYETSVNYQAFETSVCQALHADTGTPVCPCG